MFLDGVYSSAVFGNFFKDVFLICILSSMIVYVACSAVFGNFFKDVTRLQEVREGKPT